MLMRAFLMGGNCFFITGTFACHVAGVLSGYKGACLYICLTDTHLVRLLFQRADTPTFNYADFHFELQHSITLEDLFIYEVTRGWFSMKFFVFGIDVSARCGPLSNVNLVYFIWDNYEPMSTKQYAIPLVPSDTDTFSTPPSMVNAASLVNPSMICLKHYRDASDGWRDGSNFDTCVENYRSRVGSKCLWDRCLREMRTSRKCEPCIFHLGQLRAYEYEAICDHTCTVRHDAFSTPSSMVDAASL